MWSFNNSSAGYTIEGIYGHMVAGPRAYDRGFVGSVSDSHLLSLLLLVRQP